MVLPELQGLLRVGTFDVRAALEAFSEWAVGKGWRAADDGSWVKAQEGYNVFIYCRSINLSTLKSMVRSRRCSIYEDGLWSVREAEIMAFLCPKGFDSQFLREFGSSPELASKALLYDFSSLMKAGRGNAVTEEFESFLMRTYGLNFKPIPLAR